MVKEHEIKYERLHAERAERVAELYRHIIETNDAAEECLEAFEEKPDKIRFDLAAEAIKRADELAEYVARNQIYFSRSLARELGELSTCPLDAAITYKMRCEDMRQNNECSDFVELLHEVQSDIKGALKTTEEEFRKLLGVDKTRKNLIHSQAPNPSTGPGQLPNRCLGCSQSRSSPLAAFVSALIER